MRYIAVSKSLVAALRRFHTLAVIGAVLVVQGFRTHASFAAAELWMVRTYRIASIAPCPVEADRFEYFYCDARGVWARSTQEAFGANDEAERPTVVFAHGGFTDQMWASRLASGLMQVLRCRGRGRPVRVVLWQWPSERRMRRLRPALWSTMARAEFEGRLLARWLRQFDLSVPPTLVGYSAGCRVIAGGLSWFAAESAGDGVPADTAARFRTVLVAAAMDADSLLPSRPNGRAIEVVDTLLVTRHQRDRALSLYPRLYPGIGPQAMGRVGVACPQLLGQGMNRLETVDLTACIAGRHDFLHYLSAGPLAARLTSLVFADASISEPSTSVPTEQPTSDAVETTGRTTAP